MALDPNYATAHQFYAQLLVSLGRYRDAVIHIELARRADPMSPAITAYYLLSAALVFFAGPIFDRFGARLVIGVGSIKSRDDAIEPFRRIQIVDHGSTASARSSRMVQIDAIRHGRKFVKQRLIWFATVPRQRMAHVVRHAADALSHAGRISSLIRFTWAMQSIFACRSVYLSRYRSAVQQPQEPLRLGCGATGMNRCR